MNSLILILAMSVNAGPANSYMTGYNKALKENKMLFVWRGCKDDYIVKKFPNAVHLFDPDMKGIKHDFPNKGVIVASPHTKTDLKIDIQTSQIGELADKLLMPKLESKSQPVASLKPKRIIENGYYYDLYPNGSKVPCTQCNQARLK